MQKVLTQQFKRAHRGTLKDWRKEIENYKNTPTSGFIPPPATNIPTAPASSSTSSNTGGTTNTAVKGSVILQHSMLTLSAYQSQLLQVLDNFYEGVFERAISLHLRGKAQITAKLEGKLTVNLDSVWDIKKKGKPLEVAKSVLDNWKGNNKLETNIKKIIKLDESKLKSIDLHRSLRNMFQHKKGFFKKAELRPNSREIWYLDDGTQKTVLDSFTENGKIALTYTELFKLIDDIDYIIKQSK